MIPSVWKLVAAWVVFFLAMIIFVSVIKGHQTQKKPAKTDPASGTVATETSTDASGQPISTDTDTTAGQITTPMVESQDETLNQFVATYLNAMTACDQAALQSMVTDPTVYNDMTALQARAQYIQAYNNMKCYVKAGPDANSQIVFVVTNTTIANVNTAPMDFMTLYIEITESGYKINNYTLSDDIKNYIETLKQDSDIQAVMHDIETYNSMAINNDAGLKAFYQMLGQ